MKTIQKVFFLIIILLLTTNSYAGRWIGQSPLATTDVVSLWTNVVA